MARLSRKRACVMDEGKLRYGGDLRLHCYAKPRDGDTSRTSERMSSLVHDLSGPDLHAEAIMPEGGRGMSAVAQYNTLSLPLFVLKGTWTSSGMLGSRKTAKEKANPCSVGREYVSF